MTFHIREFDFGNVQSPLIDGIQFAFDSTTLTLGQECLRKYQLSFLECWEPKLKSPHLLFGGWYASALERYYKWVAQGMEREEALHQTVWQALKDTWEYAYNEDGTVKTNSQRKKIGAPWMSMHNLKTRENLIRTIIWYIDEFGADDPFKTVMKADGTPAVEYSFKLEIDSGNLLCGHIDRLVEYGDEVFVTDQKTTGSTITPSFFDQFKPNTQMSLYAFAGKAIYDMPVKGVVIDGAQIAVGFSRFMRGFTFRTDSELDEWYEGILRDIDHIQRATIDHQFPMNPNACNHYSGCQFRSVCSKSPEVRDKYLRADFQRRPDPWNPLRER